MNKLGQVWNSVRGWIWVISTALPAVATFLAGMFDGLPWSHRILFATVAAVFGAAFAFYILRGYEVVSGWYGVKKEGARLAAELDALIGVGHTSLRIGEVALMWAGEPKNDYRFNVCLRRLKQAAQLGMIAYIPKESPPAANSRADLSDAARFFRDRKWINLPAIQADPPKPRPPAPATRRQNPFLRRRSNWVTRW